MLHFRWKHAIVWKLKSSKQGVHECQVTNGEDYAGHYLLVPDLPSKLSLCIVGAEAWKPHFLDSLAKRVLFAVYQGEAHATSENKRETEASIVPSASESRPTDAFRWHT